LPKRLVIVESPAKARTIGRFLGDDFVVEASVGHIRDLPESAADIPAKYKGLKWARTAVDVENDFEPLYVLTGRGREQVKKLKALLKDSEELLLATDEDREGEAIAWHLTEALKPKVPIRRLVFHEITKRAIEASLQNARSIDMDLVRAQETRRILDRLYGYNLSPVLWRKIKPRLSAGRVQSVAVRLIVSREKERMAFVASTWWGVDVDLEAEGGPYSGNLVSLDGRKIASGGDFDSKTGQLKSTATDVVHLLEADATDLMARLLAGTAQVTDVKTRTFTERPSPPYTTSTLQQDANRRLRWSAKRAMSMAQRLYENGWITYMRTDSTHLSPEAISAARATATREFGAQVLPAEPRRYKAKAKGAQEAHEAIRPSGETWRNVSECAQAMGEDGAKLYELILQRTLACQMADATGNRMSVDTEIRTPREVALVRSRGKSYNFLGFRLVYGNDPSSEKLLPPLKQGHTARPVDGKAEGHTTQPPARFNDASLVKRLEELGIGRPSTYASIIETIQSRGYSFRRKNALVPTWTAFAVTRLLEEHFTQLVDYDFTATMEGGLDRIAEGAHDRVSFLESFYNGTADNAGLVPLIDSAIEAADPRSLCSIPLGEDDGHPVLARVGRYGPYLEHNGTTRSIPDDIAPDELTLAKAVEMLGEMPDGPRELGTDPETGLGVTLHVGRFGPYVQLGEMPEDKKDKTKPKRSSLLANMDATTLDLPTALQLLALPRLVGQTADGTEIRAYNGRYGPYVKAGKESRSIPVGIGLLEINQAQALELLAKPNRRSGPKILRELGKDPEDRAIEIKQGRFGPYMTDGDVNVTVRKGTDPADVTLEQAIDLLAQKRAAGGGKKKRTRAKPKAKKPAAKKAAAKKSPAKKKPAAKKATAAKTPRKRAAPKKKAAEVSSDTEVTTGSTPRVRRTVRRRTPKA
jgi:DNA topoisomerase-1